MLALQEQRHDLLPQHVASLNSSRALFRTRAKLPQPQPPSSRSELALKKRVPKDALYAPGRTSLPGSSASHYACYVCKNTIICMYIYIYIHMCVCAYMCTCLLCIYICLSIDRSIYLSIDLS